MSKPVEPARVSRKIGAIAESATLAVDAKAKALQAAGERVIGFGAGEPDFPTPEAHRRRRGRRRAVDPKNHRYSPTVGPARAPRGDRGQDGARLGLRRRGRAGPRDERRQARRLQHVPGAARPRRRGARSRRRTGPPTPRRSRSPTACPSCCPPPRRPTFRVTVDAARRRHARSSTKALAVRVAAATPPGAVYPPDEVEAIGRWAVAHGDLGDHRRDLRAPHLRRPHVRVDAGARPRARRHVRGPQRRREDVRDDGLARRLDDRSARRDRRGHEPAVALDVQRGQRRAARRARRGRGRPRGRRATCARRSTRRGKTMHAMLDAHPGRHLHGAAGRVLLLPELRGRARPRDRRQARVRHARRCARCSSSRRRSRSSPARRSARPGTPGSRSRSATTTSARASNGSPRSSAAEPPASRLATRSSRQGARPGAPMNLRMRWLAGSRSSWRSWSRLPPWPSRPARGQGRSTRVVPAAARRGDHRGARAADGRRRPRHVRCSAIGRSPPPTRVRPAQVSVYLRARRRRQPATSTWRGTSTGRRVELGGLGRRAFYAPALGTVYVLEDPATVFFVQGLYPTGATVDATGLQTGARRPRRQGRSAV